MPARSRWLRAVRLTVHLRPCEHAKFRVCSLHCLPASMQRCVGAEACWVAMAGHNDSNRLLTLLRHRVPLQAGDCLAGHQAAARRRCGIRAAGRHP
jgi:hypothetical protein